MENLPTERQDKTRRRLRQGSPTAVSNNEVKLQTTSKRENATRYDIQNIPEAFTVEIRNRFTPLLQYAEEECTPEELLTKTSSTMSEIAKKYIPKRKRQKKAWLKNTTMDIAEERRTAKSRGDWEGWARLNKEFRKVVNADKRDHLKERCQHLEQSNKNPKEVSKVIKEITGEWAPQTEVINDKDGNTLTESEAIMKRMGGALPPALSGTTKPSVDKIS